MAISPVQISDEATVAHQGLADKFYSLFKGAENYVEQWLPEHENKSEVLKNIAAGWDNAVSVIKADLGKTLAAAKQDAEQVAQTAATTAETDVKEIAAEAAPVAEKAVETVAQDVAQAVPAPQAPTA